MRQLDVTPKLTRMRQHSPSMVEDHTRPSGGPNLQARKEGCHPIAVRTIDSRGNQEEGGRLILGGRIGVVLRDSHGVAQVKVVTGMGGTTISQNCD